eukprot:gene8301-9862_t
MTMPLSSCHFCAMLRAEVEAVAMKANAHDFISQFPDGYETLVAYFDRRATGDLMNVMASDTVFVQKGLTNNAVTMMRSGVSAVGGAGLLVYLSPTLAAVSLCLIPPLGFMAMKFGRYLRDQQKEVQEALSRILETSESVVSNIRTEHREMSTFDDRVQHSYHESRKVGVPQAVFDGMAYLAGNMALVAVLGYGGSMVTSGAITAGELTSFLMYSMSVGLSVMSMFSAYTDAMRAAGAGVRIVEVMDRESLMPSNAGGRTLPSFRGDVSFHDVHFTYPSRPNVSVLTGLSLHVPPGRVLALVGASGCGKSTVGALLTALYAVDRGSIRFDGVDLQDLDPRWVRRAIGVVAQEPVLFSGNILDNLRYGMPYATRTLQSLRAFAAAQAQLAAIATAAAEWKLRLDPQVLGPKPSAGTYGW